MAYTPTVNRITGMSSGFDTDALVKAMTSAQQNKIDSLFSKKTVAEWKSAAITDINNMLRTFKDDYLSVLGSKSMMKTDTYNAMSVKNSSNAVSITASGTAKAGMHTIKVNQLATGAKATGSSFAVEGQMLGSTAVSLKSLMDSDLRATGAVKTVDLVDKDGNPIMITDENDVEVQVKGFEFTINGKSFQFKETDKLSDVMSQINSSGANVKMSYSQLTNSFTMESATTGSGSKLTVEESESSFFAMLGLAPSLDGGDFSGESVFDPVAGKNAIVVIDGVEITRGSNSFTVEGMTYTLNGVTESTVEFAVERDMTKTVDMVKDFVSSLNDMLSKLDTAYRERKDRSYTPLTNEMKDAMSEKEVEEWEKQAKAGLLHRDNNIDSLISGIQSALSANIEGLGSLRDIGISFGGYTAGSISKIEIDETKLKAAIEADPDKVYNLMTKSASASADNDSDKQGGILARVSASIDKYTAQTKTYDIQQLRDNVNDYVKRISEQEDKLYTMQERLYLKYAKFEQSLSQLQSQQNTLAGYFA